MASDDSVSDAGVARFANAYVAHPNLAQMRGSEYTRLIDGVDWHEHDASDFHQRFVVGQHYRASSDETGVPRLLRGPPSATSSMALTQSPSVYSNTSNNSSWLSTPSLVSSGTAATSGSSVRTSRVDSVVLLSILDEDEQGALVPPKVELKCLYHWLKCDFASDDLEEWDTHCRFHFRGNLPRSLECPFECRWSVTASTGSAAWEQRLAHMCTHPSSDMIVSDKKPSTALLQHLHKARIIDAVQMQELRQEGRLGHTVLVQSAGTTSEGRRERHGPAGSPRGQLNPGWR